ncbi:MAG TPA: helix-turn-helix domain-containing protein [Solirubrobacteraceae bacterium]|nr:helix-turn-helix domain-containing protein [Solirubrobacteraceae bacterium]
MSSSLTRIRAGLYRHKRLGVEVERTAIPDTPWQLAGPDPEGSGVVLARTLGDARAFLREIEEHVDHEDEARTRAGALRALGAAVRQERERAGLSAAALAAASGIQASQLEALEVGRVDAELDLLLVLAEALDIQPSTLFVRAETLTADGQSSPDVAERALLALHRYLYPERYGDVPDYEWHAGTIEDVAAMIEQALVNDPRAELSPK